MLDVRLEAKSVEDVGEVPLARWDVEHDHRIATEISQVDALAVGEPMVAREQHVGFGENQDPGRDLLPDVEAVEQPLLGLAAGLSTRSSDGLTRRRRSPTIARPGAVNASGRCGTRNSRGASRICSRSDIASDIALGETCRRSAAAPTGTLASRMARARAKVGARQDPEDQRATVTRDRSSPTQHQTWLPGAFRAI